MHVRRTFFLLPLLLLFLFSSAQAGKQYLLLDYEEGFESLEGSSHFVTRIKGHEEFPAASDPNLKVVDAAKIFTEDTFFFGFGLPNVYMGRVRDGKFVKYAAKSLFRADSAIETTDGRTQSGFFLVPKSFPPSVLETIIQKVHEHEGERTSTCARSNATILAEAGCKIRGEADDSLMGYFFPSSLLRDFLEKGLDCGGIPIELDLIASTPKALPEFFAEITRQERVYYTARRHINTHCDTPQNKGLRLEEAKKIRTRNDSAPVLLSEEIDEVKFDIKTGKVGTFGTYLRSIWGEHPIFEVDLRNQNVRVDDYLTTNLKAFPHQNPSWATRLKKELIFSPTVTDFLRSEMASDYNCHRGICEKSLLGMLKDMKYNFVITPDEIIIARLNNGQRVSWALSKHALLANYNDNVRFAGEFWKDGDTIYINNNSGTYMPTEEMLAAAVSFLQALAPNLTLIGELHVEN